MPAEPRVAPTTSYSRLILLASPHVSARRKMPAEPRPAPTAPSLVPSLSRLYLVFVSPRLCVVSVSSLSRLCLVSLSSRSRLCLVSSYGPVLPGSRLLVSEAWASLLVSGAREPLSHSRLVFCVFLVCVNSLSCLFASLPCPSLSFPSVPRLRLSSSSRLRRDWRAWAPSKMGLNFCVMSCQCLDCIGSMWIPRFLEGIPREVLQLAVFVCIRLTSLALEYLFSFSPSPTSTPLG